MSLFDPLEEGARRLSRCLQSPLPEHHLLCALRFFGLFWSNEQLQSKRPLAEPYVRQFLPKLASAAQMCNPGEFLQSEVEDLKQLAALVTPFCPGVVSPDHLAALNHLVVAAAAGEIHPPPVIGQGVVLAGLLVEHAPNLGLPARGRQLWLRIAAEERKRKFTEDDPVVSNVLSRPNNETQEQAHVALQSARQLLSRHYGLKPDRRFRVTFHIESATAALEGPSLGVAFAIGAAAAIAQDQTFRDRLEIPDDVAFTGELSTDGAIRPVDGQGLRLKIERALHNRVRYLVLPAAQMTQAWQCLNELGQNFPNNHLKLVAASDLPSIFEDRNLVHRQRRTRTQYLALRARRTLQEPRVGVPIFVSLLIMLGILAGPGIVKRFDRTPASVAYLENGFKVVNEYGVTLWKEAPVCSKLTADTTFWAIAYLYNDGRREVIVQPSPLEPCERNDRVEVYDPTGRLLFWRRCHVDNEYPGDTIPGLYYWPHGLYVRKTRIGHVMVTAMNQQNPSRTHIRFWSARGDSLGWYINAGATRLVMTRDFDGDDIEDFFFIGYNIRMRAAALYVLAADKAYGVAPPYSDRQYDLSRVHPGNQLLYVIFPSTDVSDADTSLYNAPYALSLESDSSYRMEVQEGKCQNCIVDYYLDKKLHVEHVDVTDEFKAYRRKLVADRRISGLQPDSIDWSGYFNQLGDSVLYWTSRGWESDALRRHLKDSAQSSR